jgi:hypothetical protein
VNADRGWWFYPWTDNGSSRSLTESSRETIIQYSDESTHEWAMKKGRHTHSGTLSIPQAAEPPVSGIP